MKKSRILPIILFVAFSTFIFSTPAASLEEESGSSTVVTPIHPSHPVVVIDTEPKTRWEKAKACFTGCMRKTKLAAQQVLPMFEFALPFIQDEELRRTIQGAINAAKMSTKLIEFNEDGSLKLPSGQEISNAVLLVVTDKIKLLTDESKMFLALIMSRLPATDYKTKIQLTGYLAAVDNPQTPFLLGFDADAGKVQLLNEKTTFPVEALPLFSSTTDDATKTLVRAYFTEYMEASEARTAAETDGKRAAGIFFLPKGKILTDYANLTAHNTSFAIAKLAENVIRGETSVRGAIDSLA